MVKLNKHNFLKILERNLKYLTEEEKKDVMDEYRTHYEDAAREEQNEIEISNNLGKPEEIAKELNAIYAIKKAEQKKSFKNLSAAIFSIMGLSVLNCFVILGGGIALLILSPFIIAYIIGVPLMLLAPLLTIVAGFIYGFHLIGFDEIFEAGRAFVVGCLLAIIGYYVGKHFVKLAIRNLKWNVSIVKGRS
ncbi:HAAS signaling domain-containing protein [Alkalihalobacillus sp. NPDC078783]|uniref:HAAS signaling domain-containing protein n=1 Tax=Alkalicoccobacillus gibsonii TaxID=79881 RepID=UPI003512AB1C